MFNISMMFCLSFQSMIETEKQTKGESDEKRNGSKTHFCIRHGDGSGDAVSFPAGESACAKDLLGGDRESISGFRRADCECAGAGRTVKTADPVPE
ncbi:hypothetical protein [Blautia sp. AF26-2]|uniref:hypothetical protein n=1 Tax=Blautia sp. AF26-2 TaxID=2292966 RepID=UPI0011C1B709